MRLAITFEATEYARYFELVLTERGFRVYRHNSKVWFDDDIPFTSIGDALSETNVWIAENPLPDDRP